VSEERRDLVGQLSHHGIAVMFDHAAVAAPRLRDLLTIYQDLLGGEFIQGGDNQRVGYRAIHLGFHGGTKIELMEPLAGSTFFDRFFQTRGGGGLHHITFKVDDIERAVERVKAAGFAITGLYLEEARWREVFLHPKEAFGTLVQLAQPGPGYEPTGGQTLEEVLAGRGMQGNGLSSP